VGGRGGCLWLVFFAGLLCGCFAGSAQTPAGPASLDVRFSAENTFSFPNQLSGKHFMYDTNGRAWIINGANFGRPPNRTDWQHCFVARHPPPKQILSQGRFEAGREKPRWLDGTRPLSQRLIRRVCSHQSAQKLPTLPKTKKTKKTEFQGSADLRSFAGARWKQLLKG